MWQEGVWMIPGVREGWRGDLQMTGCCVRVSVRSWFRTLIFIPRARRCHRSKAWKYFKQDCNILKR